MFPPGIANQLFDKEIKALVSIDTVHRMVHLGRTFQSSYKSPEGADIADNGALTILIQTGVSEVHLAWHPASGGDAEIELYEGAAFSDAGVLLPRINMKRRANAYIPKTLTSVAPTITSLGARLMNELLPGGTGPAQSGGGLGRPGTEWQLLDDTNYVLRLTNRSGSAQPASFIVQWYEIDHNRQFPED
jgi:hypothetical protein